MKKVFIITGFIILVFITVVVFLQKPNQQVSTTQNKTTIVPKDFTKDYSSLNKLFPGKSTKDDVLKINGAPLSTTTNGDETTLYYPTPSKEFKNIVVLKNNVEFYSIENIFNSYRGTYENFQTAYGKPDLTLYNTNEDPYLWQIFLNQGLGVETNKKDIMKILYFIPQTEEGFLSTIAKEQNLSIENITPEAPRP